MFYPDRWSRISPKERQRKNVLLEANGKDYEAKRRNGEREERERRRETERDSGRGQ